MKIQDTSFIQKFHEVQSLIKKRPIDSSSGEVV